MRLTRSRAVVAAVPVAIAVSAASVAYACVAFPETTKFKVKNAAGTADVTAGSTGDTLRAVGTRIQIADHPYQIKLIARPWNDPALPDVNAGGIGVFTDINRCGQLGTLQTVARTSSSPVMFDSSFDQQFTLTYSPTDVPPGPLAAHFCAIPYTPEPVISGTLGALEGPYIYQPFSLTLL